MLERCPGSDPAWVSELLFLTSENTRIHYEKKKNREWFFVVFTAKKYNQKKTAFWASLLIHKTFLYTLVLPAVLAGFCITSPT